MQSLSLLQSSWPEAELLPQDVGGLASAARCFMRLLKQADTSPQLETLAQLLMGPWQHGLAFLDQQV